MPLLIGAAVIVANQAIDFFLVFEIKVLVFPAVTGMTGRAGRPVTLDANTEIVDAVLFADRNRFVTAFDHHRFGLPAPMRRVEYLFTCAFVAGQAGRRHFRAAAEALVIEQILVINVGWTPGHMLPGFIHLKRVRRGLNPGEEPDRKGNQDQYYEQAHQPVLVRVFHVHT